MSKDILYSSASDDWPTPQDFFDALDKEFHFTLDPCADDDNHKCAKYYTKADDGLSKSWRGERVYVNPPYGRAVPRWVEKAVQETTENGCPLVVFLLPARTDTKWFHDYLYGQAEIRFVKSRLKFGGRDRAPFPSMVCILRGGS